MIPSWLRSLCTKGCKRGSSIASSTTTAAPYFTLNDGQKWFDSFRYLVEVEGYVQLRNKIFNEEGRIVMPNTGEVAMKKVLVEVDGKSGVGNSCFVVWLISCILARAKLYRERHLTWPNEPSSQCIHSPRILYTLATNCWLLEVNKVSAAYGADYYTCDYFFADDADIGIADQCSSFKLILSTSSDPTKLTEFRKRMDEAGDRAFRHKLLSLSFYECQKLFVDTQIMLIEDLQFRYDIVGGNPRFIRYSGNIGGTVVDEKLKEAINEALSVVFGEDYVVEDSCFIGDDIRKQRGWWAISSICEKAIPKTRYDERLSSLFLQWTSVGREYHQTFSSAFMGILSTIISTKEESAMISAVRAIFRYNDYGNLIDYVAHRAILDKKQVWHAVSCKSEGALTLPFDHLERYAVRDISDLDCLPDCGYGWPTIANFPVVDAVVRVQNHFYLLQMTVANRHGTSEALQRIMEACQKAVPDCSARFAFIWILVDNFTDFQENPLVTEMGIPQYKTLQSHATEDQLRSAQSRVHKVSSLRLCFYCLLLVDDMF